MRAPLRMVGFLPIFPTQKLWRKTRMHSVTKIVIGAVAMAAIGATAHAQGDGPQQPNATINDPPGALPDAGHIPVKTPADIKWEGRPGIGEEQAVLFGDSNKPGMYGVLIKWNPGYFSHPHFHDQERYICVISGTWWVSSSTHYDPKTTYPVKAGDCSQDVANTVHWDGARLGGPPAILELVGMGPVKTIQVDEQGKPLPPRAPAAH
jgi:hypothetical protein